MNPLNIIGAAGVIFYLVYIITIPLVYAVLEALHLSVEKNKLGKILFFTLPLIPAFFAALACL